MIFTFEINDLTFVGAIKHVAQLKKLEKEISLVDSRGYLCNLTINIKDETPAYPTGMLFFLDSLTNLIKKLDKLNIEYVISNNNYLNYIGFLSFRNDYDESYFNSRAGSSNIPVSKVTRTMIDEVITEKHVSIGEATEIVITKYAELISHFDHNLIKPFTYIIREIARNSFEHSNTEEIFICIQHWKNRDEIEIAIADTGIGIYNSLNSNLNYKPYLNSGEDALKLSLEPGISKAYSRRKKFRISNWDNSGYGLFYAHQLCMRLNGSFTIGSYDSRLFLKNNEIENVDFNYQGTIVGMIFKPSYLKNFKNIINDINNELKKREKSLQHFFVNPSKSSLLK